MKRIVIVNVIALITLVAAAPTLQAQAQPQTDQKQNGLTKPLDRVPKFNMDYFVGDWQFEWAVPDGPLGDGGTISGTEHVIKQLDGRFYQIAIEGNAPDGPYVGNGMMIYLDTPAGQYLVRYEVERGMAFLEPGVLGGDLGGNYSQFWETPPMQRGGKSIRLRGRSLFSSPAAYRVTVEMSVDSGDYESAGVIIYTKQSPAQASGPNVKP